jgi:hypothetical protein
MLADIRCAAGATATAYACSGQLPALVAGAHLLELAAVDRGVEGPRSAPFPVTVNLSASTSAANDLTPASSARIVCLDPEVDECFDALTIASGLGAVSDLTAAPDGRAFLIENERTVRVLGPDGLSPTPALTAQDVGERLVSLALSPDFSHTRSVYVGWVEEGPGGPEFTVRRYREVAGVLGQGAAIVSGLPLGESIRVPLAIDSQEHIFVALPAAPEEAARRSAFAFNGNVLRFAPDGSVPVEQSSPILTRGYDQPSALMYDRAGSRLWLGGSPAAWNTPLALISLEKGSDLAHSSIVSGLRTPMSTASGERSLQMPVIALRSRGNAQELWLTDGDAYRGTVSGGAVQRLQPVETDLGDIAAIAAMTENDLLVVVRQGANGNLGVDIVRLVPRPTAPGQ